LSLPKGWHPTVWRSATTVSAAEICDLRVDSDFGELGGVAEAVEGFCGVAEGDFAEKGDCEWSLACCSSDFW